MSTSLHWYWKRGNICNSHAPTSATWIFSRMQYKNNVDPHSWPWRCSDQHCTPGTLSFAGYLCSLSSICLSHSLDSLLMPVSSSLGTRGIMESEHTPLVIFKCNLTPFFSSLWVILYFLLPVFINKVMKIMWKCWPAPKPFTVIKYPST